MCSLCENALAEAAAQNIHSGWVETEYAPSRQRLGYCLKNCLSLGQVVKDGVFVDVGGLAGVLGFMARDADPVDGAEDGAHRRAELGLHGVHDGEMPALGGGPQSLRLQERG
jgi:hypothetical protein